jgi:hypothetical protein
MVKVFRWAVVTRDSRLAIAPIMLAGSNDGHPVKP